ncbi:hypothetical protein K438DRAFT_1959178 [Mycena galopus ATCC 62051]|nr:hypothetical protein K438DRAFT_1959178 [Mycena galopus ATCC 62051]
MDIDEDSTQCSLDSRIFHRGATPHLRLRKTHPQSVRSGPSGFRNAPDFARPDAVLQALTVALFIPSIKHLLCIFPATYAYRRIDSIGRVARLMQRLTTVEKLSLDFMPANHYRPGTFRRKDYSEARLWQKCYSALRDLLDTVDGKSCTSLTILGTPASIHATDAPSSPAPSIRSLSHLSLDAGLFPGYFSWIFSALKTSRIASLKLNIADDTQLTDAATNFPATLTCLSLDGGNVLPPTVLNYLGRHPLLKNLTLGSALLRDQRTHVDPLYLTNLVTLTASFSYVSHFFLHTFASPFPVLEHLTIVLDSEDVGWSFASLISGGLLNVGSLTDSIKFASSMGGKWTHAARHVSELTINCDSAWFRSSDTSVWVDPVVAQLLLNWFRLFSCVCTITILPHDRTLSTVGALADFANVIGETLSSVRTIRFTAQMLSERS